MNEEEIIVYRSYRIEQTSDELVSGGDLAPIELKKERTLTKETILGQWKSTEPDYPAFIRIKATFDPDKIELVIAKNAETEELETVPLTFEARESELIYFNNDQTIRYSFSYDKESRMILSSFSTQKGATRTVRPWILERVFE